MYLRDTGFNTFNNLGQKVNTFQTNLQHFLDFP